MSNMLMFYITTFIIIFYLKYEENYNLQNVSDYKFLFIQGPKGL